MRALLNASLALTLAVPRALLGGGADRVARHLPRVRHIVDSSGHHGSSLGCARPAVMHVFREGTLEGAPEACK